MSHWQELTNFSSLLHQLSSMGYTSDIHEVSPFLLLQPSAPHFHVYLALIHQVLERVSGMIPFLKESTKHLSSSSESLGAVRQETRVSDLVKKNVFISSISILCMISCDRCYDKLLFIDDQY